MQAVHYCEWKTDRLNEYILIKENCLKVNPYQEDEDNFNTAAYWGKQYVGERKDFDQLPRANTPHYEAKSKKIWDKFDQEKWEDKILWPAFRLPSEDEWNYAKEKLAMIDFDEIPNYYQYLQSDEYYINQWTNYFYPDRKKLLSGMTKMKNTDASFGFDNNINEWVYDLYSTQNKGRRNAFDNYNLIPVEAYTKCVDAECLEKDSLEKMYFTIIGEEENGQPILARRFPVSYYRSIRSEYGGVSIPVYNKGKTRVYKGSSSRDSLNELKSKPNLGFRCVMSKVD